MNKVLVKWSQHFLKECHEMWLCQLVSHNITSTDTNNVCTGRLVTLCMCEYITEFCLTTSQTVSTLFYRKKCCCDDKLLTIKTYLTTNNVMGGASGYIHQLTTMLQLFWPELDQHGFPCREYQVLVHHLVDTKRQPHYKSNVNCWLE